MTVIRRMSKESRSYKILYDMVERGDITLLSKEESQKIDDNIASEMDKIKKYIISLIKRLKKIYPNIHARYAYDNSSFFHIVEISPRKLFKNEDFIKTIYKESDDFIESFRNENLLIDEESDNNNMTNIKYKSK